MTPTITDYLKYANLQMAAEAFLVNIDRTVKADIPKALTEGNNHAFKFTSTQATDFDALWVVVDQRANTTTGFSGTLFKARETVASLGILKDELVLSMRSTEFIDDAVRDSAATGSLEIKETGWAWGQIASMEDWYKSLSVRGGPLEGKQFVLLEVVQADE